MSGDATRPYPAGDIVASSPGRRPWSEIKAQIDAESAAVRAIHEHTGEVWRNPHSGNGWCHVCGNCGATVSMGWDDGFCCPQAKGGSGSTFEVECQGCGQAMEYEFTWWVAVDINPVPTVTRKGAQQRDRAGRFAIGRTER